MRQNDQLVIRMRSAIADLKYGSVTDAEYEENPVASSPIKIADAAVLPPGPEAAKAEPISTVFAAAKAAASADAQPAESSEVVDHATVVAAQLLLAELRKASEALVREVSVLETRVNEEAQVVEATRDYAAATKKAEGAAIVEQQAIELAQAASTQYNAAMTTRQGADDLAASTRTDAETVQAQIANLERWLQDARQLAQETSSKLGQCESRAKECAAVEDAARCEAAEAAARVAACQAASVAAAKEAQAAQQRAEALRQMLPDSAPSFAGISNVQTLATRIVEEAGALARKTQGDPLSDTAQWQW